MAKVIVVYGGGFQPFHAGHLSSYLEAKEAFPKADFYVAASNDTKTRPIPFNDKQFLAQQAGVSSPFVQVKAPINPKEILDRYSPKQDIFILVRSERDPVGYTKKDGSPGYYQPFVSLDKCEPFGYHGYVFVTHKKEFKLNGQVVYSGTQVRDMYANNDDKGRLNIIKQLYPKSSEQGAIKQMLDKYIGNVEPIVEPDKSAIKQLKAKKLKEQIQRMRPLLKEASFEQKYKFLKLMKEATQLNELDLFKKKKSEPVKVEPETSPNDYHSYFSKPEPKKEKVYRNPGEYVDDTKIDPLTGKKVVDELNLFGKKPKAPVKPVEEPDDYRKFFNREPVSLYEPQDVKHFHNSRDYHEKTGVNPLLKKQPVKEFAIPGGDDNGPDEDEILFRLAKQWWLGTEQDMIRAERTLASMGWEIGEDEGSYDNGGVFVVRAGDVNGKSYMSWPHEDLIVDEGQTSDMRNFFSTQQPLNPAPITPTTTGPTIATVTRQSEGINEISDETLQSYLGKADRQVSNRLDRMSQARERLNKNYEIYDVENPSRIIDRFEANSPELAREYYYKFIKEFNPGDQDFHFEVRRSTGLSEEGYPNQQMSLYKSNGKTYRNEKMPTLDNPEDIYNKANRYNFDDNVELPDEFSGDSNIDDSIKELISSKLNELEPKERKILQLRYWHDMTLADIADRFNVSNERIRQIEARAMRKIKKSTLAFNPGSLKMYVPEDDKIAESRIIYAGSKVNLILVYKQKPILLNKEPVAYTDENLQKYAVVAYMHLRNTTGRKFSIDSIKKAIVVKPLEVHQTNEESNDYLEEK